MPRILIVEDDFEISFIVKYLLSNEGFVVATDNTGANIHSLIITFHPDLILLDAWLPEGNGLKICQEIKAQYKIPVIIFSAAYFTSNQIEKACADDYIQKPFDIDELKECIRKYVTKE